MGLKKVIKLIITNEWTFILDVFVTCNGVVGESCTIYFVLPGYNVGICFGE